MSINIGTQDARELNRLFILATDGKVNSKNLRREEKIYLVERIMGIKLPFKDTFKPLILEPPKKMVK